MLPGRIYISFTNQIYATASETGWLCYGSLRTHRFGNRLDREGVVERGELGTAEGKQRWIKSTLLQFVT